jgi:hypothetical protein
VSRDGLTIYFASSRGLKRGSRIWVARRAKDVEPFGSPEPIAELEPASDDAPTWLSPDGCTLWFTSTRAGGLGGRDVWSATRLR